MNNDEDSNSGEEDEQFSDDMSSSPAILEKDIDFDLVYALRTFLANVEGQASVVKGDSLTLLDDSNSYWWLVKVLKTSAVGYIPAENIETPHERLARLNKHRNVDLTSVIAEDHVTGPQSAIARHRLLASPPLSNRNGKSPSPHPVHIPSNGKSVVFTAPTYHEHSGYEFTTTDEDEEDEDMLEGEGGFDDDEDELEDDDDEEEDIDDMHQMEEEHTTTVHEKMRRQDGHNIAAEHIDDDGIDGGDESDKDIQSKRKVNPKVGNDKSQKDSLSSSILGKESVFPDDQDTRKITLTPQVARDDPNVTPLTADPQNPSVLTSRPLGTKISDTEKRAISTESLTNSTSTGASIDSNAPYSEDHSLISASPTDTAGKKGRKDKGKDDKKKSGSMFGGLFSRRKDKKGKKSPDDASDMRSSDDSGRGTPVDPYDSQKPDSGSDSFTDAALKKQRLEARQAMFNQYGVSRAPGDKTNTTVFRQQLPPSNLNSSVSSLAPPKDVVPSNIGRRPGSLIGSTGLDIPVLSVLRVFAGDNVTTDSTFKTVLINSATSTSDLLSQIVQRFRLPTERMDEYALIIKDFDGQVTELQPHQKPLNIFEELSDGKGDRPLPSVNRSSIGSISSIASDLSLNPAISKLGMNDWSDDSAVKFFINRRKPDSNGTQPQVDLHNSTSQAPADEDSHSVGDGASLRQSLSTPSYRFALRITITADELPETMAFDATSPTSISRSNSGHSFQGRDSSDKKVSSSNAARERILYIPTNTTVAEVIELGLEKFGILEGVVDGGDEVEVKLSRRRSISRVRYCLVVDGQYEKLNSSARILDAYDISPILKPHERGSKEFLRRSNDINLLSSGGSSTDIQSTDPIFSLKRANRSAPHSPRQLPRTVSGSLIHADELDQKRSPNLGETDSSVPSMYETPTMLEDISGENSPQHRMDASPSSGSPPINSSLDRSKQQEIIAAQRAASLASQKALLSQRNVGDGLPDEPRITRTALERNEPAGAIVMQSHKSNQIKYNGDVGVNLLMTIIEHSASRMKYPKRERTRDELALEDLFGPKLSEDTVSDETVKLFEPHLKAIDELDSKLDGLLAQTLRIA